MIDPLTPDGPPTTENELYREFGDRLLVASDDLTVDEPPQR